jgi:hypothetical protein
MPEGIESKLNPEKDPTQKRVPLPEEDSELLDYLLNEACQNIGILIHTKDYEILNTLKSRVDKWTEKVNNLEIGGPI